MEEKKMERQDEKGRLAMAENNYGDNNKIEALLCTALQSEILKFLSKNCQHVAKF